MKLVLSAVLSVFILGCSEDKVASLGDEIAKQGSDVAKAVSAKSEELVQETKDIAQEKIETISEKVSEASEVTQETVENIKEKATEKINEVTENTVENIKEKAAEKVNKAAVEVEKIKVEIVAEEKRIVNTSSVDGSQLFLKCTSCHGQNAEKKALGKSQVIKGWSSDKLISAINGYKDGSYGGAMKGVMKSYASALSDEEVSAISKYISEIK